tara:strand:+ start:441 stop:728 length:288 start_codon:yes stop_codon:yes gene_type:complete
MIGLQEESHGDADELKSWYVFRYINSSGEGIHAIAFQTEDGIAIRAKSHGGIDINFANTLIDEWIKKEFFGGDDDDDEDEDMDDSGDESVKRHGG